MLALKGETVFLRALEPGDLDFLYELENNTSLWEISHTNVPYSRHLLQQYLEQAHRDIYEVKQLRLCICTLDKARIGLIDLFDFDPAHRRAGLGIVILEEGKRNRGAGTEALFLMSRYAFGILGLHQLYANVGEENAASIHLFSKMGFEQTGIKKDWNLSEGRYKNEIMFQKIHD